MQISGFSSVINQLSQTNKRQQKIFEQLSTGKKVNSAKDDPSTLALAEKLKSSINELNVKNQNISYQSANIQTTSGQLSSSSDSLQRARELAVQASNGTLSDQDRANLQKEFNQAVQSASENSSVELNLDDVDISTQSGAEDALASIDSAQDDINSEQADLGAQQNALEYQQSANSVQAENLAAAKSQAIDTDYAQAIAELAKEKAVAAGQIASFRAQQTLAKTFAKALLEKPKS